MANRFHADEALYGYWGLLIGSGQDPWLTSSPAYKPPLTPYLIAGAQMLFGDAEFTVRLPGLAAGLLTVVLAAALSRVLYDGRWAGLWAAAGVALSPYAILFSATAFTDPLMVMLGLAGCVAAARARPGWAGLWVGLACAAKQTGAAWSPLALALYVLRASERRGWARMLGAWAATLAMTFGWDAIRVWRGGASFWQTGVTGYGGLRLIWPQALWPRLRAWITLTRYFFASSLVQGVLFLGGLTLVWLALRRRPLAEGHVARDAFLGAIGRCMAASFADLLLIAFALVYFLLHWLLAFPVWDRYLLPLLPVLSVLLGRALAVWAGGIGQIVDRLKGGRGRWIALSCSALLVGALATPAWRAAHSRYPVGGEHWAYDGIDQAVDFLCGVPEGSVLYHHWLGWHYAYYLFDAPLYHAYWPTPAWLAQDVQAFGAREPRYIVFPSWESSARPAQALTAVGYGLTPVLETTRRDGARSFTVYRILPLPDTGQ